MRKTFFSGMEGHDGSLWIERVFDLGRVFNRVKTSHELKCSFPFGVSIDEEGMIKIVLPELSKE